MTNLQNRKAELEMEIAKLQAELQEVNEMIADERASAVAQGEKNKATLSVLRELTVTVEENARKYDTFIEEIIEEVIECDEKIAAYYSHVDFQSCIQVIGINGKLVVNEDGTADLYKADGDFVKSYKKLGSAVKALGNI